MNETSHSSSQVKTTAPTTGPSSVPMPPNASMTMTRTSTLPNAYVDGPMNPSLWAYSAPARPSMAEPMHAGEDPVPP